MSVWSYALSFLDFCAAYFATLLGRCALASFPVLGLVLLLRKTLRRRSVFTRGAAWAGLLPVLFLGKLDVYYKSRIFLPFVQWQSWCGGHWWLRWGYLAGVAVSLALLASRRLRLRKMLRGLPSVSIGGRRVRLCDMPVSPFTAGLVFPKIVIPEIARRELDEAELETILLHERTHIRQGHLWCFLLWDVLCALLWADPLLRLSTPRLKGDMERICDAAPAACALCFLLAAGLAIGMASLPRYTELTGFTVFQIVDDVEFVRVYDARAGEQLPLTVLGGDAVAVDNAALRAVLPAGSPEDGAYYIMWGGFLKLPGLGGAMNAVYIDGLSEGAATTTAFEDVNELLYIKLAKWI